MKISTRGRYGLRAMLDLAVFSRGEHVALNAIAERQNISENYLEQVFSILRKAGLVRSVKGAQGGYTLAMEPAQVTVGMILRALEGELAVVDEENSGEGVESAMLSCLQSNVWDPINASMNQVADSISLQDLVDSFNNINEAPMYYI
ncbi:MAG TPA: Rrf2 family transcriptional regulator [Bacillota bacterium]|nr:Rrf2 family transcriptional regulator [Bacillota bacterium]